MRPPPPYPRRASAHDMLRFMRRRLHCTHDKLRSYAGPSVATMQMRASQFLHAAGALCAMLKCPPRKEAPRPGGSGPGTTIAQTLLDSGFHTPFGHLGKIEGGESGRSVPSALCCMPPCISAAASVLPLPRTQAGRGKGAGCLEQWEIRRARVTSRWTCERGPVLGGRGTKALREGDSSDA